MLKICSKIYVNTHLSLYRHEAIHKINSVLVFLLCDFAFKEIYYHSKPLQELKNLHISLSKQVSGFKKKKKVNVSNTTS